MWRETFNSACSRYRVSIIQKVLFNRFDESKAYVLTSSPRSGSTLLGQMLGSIPDTCTLFEPLHPEQVPEAKAAGFTRRTYVPPEQPWPDGEAFLRKVFCGRLINGWMIREMSVRDAYFAKRMIVKFVRANRILPWMCRTFRIPPPVLLLRHPCAVIASQLKAGWALDNLPEIPRFLDEFPLFRSVHSRASSVEEIMATWWALDQLPALLEPRPRPWAIITYEELVSHPEPTLRKILGAWGLDIDMGGALMRLKRPSSVVSSTGIRGLEGWKRDLTGSQISRILATVNAFGLSFYGTSNEADLNLLYGDGLTESLRRAGLGAEQEITPETSLHGSVAE